MKNIILSSGIAGFDWSASIDFLVTANSVIGHIDNVMLSTKGKYDDLILAETEIEQTHKKLKPQFKGHLTRLLKAQKSQISFLSDPIFLDSGAPWQTLNEEKSFAFFFCSPEYYLAKTEEAASSEGAIDQQECLDLWLEGASKIWDFYVRYPDNTLLINVEDVEKDASLSVSKILEFLEYDVDGVDNNQAESSVESEIESPIGKLSSLLLQNIMLETIKASTELNDLYENLALTSILADNALTYDVCERANIRLSECQNLIVAIATQQTQLESESTLYSASKTKALAENESTKTRIAELESQHTTMQQNLATNDLNSHELKDYFAARTRELESHITDISAQKKLALLQINQLQRELEATYLNTNALKSEFAENVLRLKTKLSDLKAENQLASFQTSHLQEELETSYVSSDIQKSDFAKHTWALETRLKETSVENELALLQINQLQEELEHYFVEYQRMTYSPKRDIPYTSDLNRVKHSLSLMSMN